MSTTSPALPEQAGIGLALSGGGYRATLFHLGSLRCIAELGVLDQVTHISSVSGGSITAGVLAADWISSPQDSALIRVQHVTAKLREFCSHTIDTQTIVGGALNPFRRISDLLTNKYDHALFHGLTLAQLAASGPRFTFCSTNLQTGRLVYLERGAIADYRIGRCALDIPLARAVAASSAFPPFLSPVEIDCRHTTWTAGPYSTLTNDPHYTQRLYLTDGGAYDNMGLEPMWDDTRTVLVSDAGAPYKSADEISSDWFSQLHAAFEIATDQARGVRKRWLIERFNDTVKPLAGAYWGIETQISHYELADAIAVPELFTQRMASMRTRLDAFSADEQEDLINWGYAVCDAAMRKWCPAVCRQNTAPVLPFPNRPFQ